MSGSRRVRSNKKVLARHAAMVLDPLRTNELSRAIHKIIKRGDVVCDIGAGLGLLSYFALSAGAKFVYAIDCDGESLSVAADHARTHGLSDRIAFIEGHSADVHLPEKADVIVCETIGSAAFDENILATLSDAKKRFLKAGGRIIPEDIELWGAPATFKKPKGGQVLDIMHVDKKHLLSKPAKLVRIETSKKFNDNIRIRREFIIGKSGQFSGIAIWPRIEWAEGFVTDASPLKPKTHWKQCVLPEHHGEIKTGEKIIFEMIIRPDIPDPKKKTEILWKSKILSRPHR